MQHAEVRKPPVGFKLVNLDPKSVALTAWRMLQSTDGNSPCKSKNYLAT